MKQKTFYIYKHTSPSGKVYIGQTNQTMSMRFRHDGVGYKSCPYFYASILKYGWDNFTHEILESGLTKEEADDREKYYISLYKSNDKRFGYNMAEGGSTCAGVKRDDNFKKRVSEFFKGKPLSEEHRKKIGESQKGKIITEEQRLHMSESQKGKKLSDDTKRKMSIAQTGRIVSDETRQKLSLINKGKKMSQEAVEAMAKAHRGKPSWNKGKAWSDEWKQNMSEQSKNRKDLVKPIVCIETGIEYISSAEAERQLGISQSHIASCCKGKRKTAGGYHWEYANKEPEV